ncbi:4-hydroxyphenylacetate 3-monooxygenase [Bradyrhizobium sp. KBS0727]|uniref:4-hydroxyphenylacetate 3-hydroxylase family protein n=1 Tax=unclassified Bradyrhizobium TaxID=2631580 RepID=UPI00110F425F|nr:MULTISPECIES: 4-hydroxyphenylacetate 3-hydroxylase N-terminal domain-containing protein [unclassified Bradyrhizobium]QDW38119.1 4-hydroxyphenylacetate 3-monooxygenase [Bradyrhizobium sp. KBS0725]QDW44723.1 4-hydroxyphenylacetate 3-monooxygenase [Bradyrhizobium sp. KBS0727]
MTRSAKEYLSNLKDGRTIYINGDRVADVTAHHAFRNVATSMAGLFDFANAPANRELMTFDTGAGRANRIWQLPTCYAELVERRKALEAWASLHAGFMGRAPDHVASCISGLYMGLDVFKAYDPARAGALEAYYRYARDNDLYLTYVIINPQADRSKEASEQADPFLTAGVVDRDAEGITIRGAKMLATGGVVADEVFVTTIQPMRPGEERYAMSFAIPMNTKGLKLLSRKSYEDAARAVFDNPLASRFDENDSVLYFDDVKVPWDRVFIEGNVEMCQKQFHATPCHVYQNYQAMVRLNVKLKFLTGLAHRTAEMNGVTQFPQVREMLGQLAAETGMVDALVAAMEAKGAQVGAYFVPDRHTLYAAQVLTQQLYPRIVNTLRELAGGGMIMLPSSVADFANPEIAALIDKTQQSPKANSRDRVKFYKLAWDAVGSEFGSRHQQYEMFYSGATFVTKGHSYRTYDWAGADKLVQGMLDSYDVNGVVAATSKAA